MKRRRIVLLASAAAVLAGTTQPAYAYIDPGTGSMLMQMVVAGLAAAGGAIAYYWSRVRNFFSFRRKSTPDQE